MNSDLSVCFIAPHALPDRASGASLWMHTALKLLAERGVRCASITASCFDGVMADDPASEFSRWLRRRAMRRVEPADRRSIRIWHSAMDGIEQLVLQTSVLRREALTAVDELVFADLVEKQLLQMRPDIVLSYGGMLLDEVLRRRARALGCRNAFFLANANYQRPSAFADVDGFVTDSMATADLYRHRFKLNLHCVGNLVDIRNWPGERRQAQFCTLINPSPQKGVGVLLRLIQMAEEAGSGIRFLVVESRHRLADAIARLKLSPELLSRVELVSAQDDLRAIYARSRVLLFPSLGHESSGRVLIEALSSGVPVLASDIGGIPETLHGAGTLLGLPSRLHQNPQQLPSAAEIEPWWRELQRLWSDPAHYDHCAAAARAVAIGHHAIGPKVDALHRWLLALKAGMPNSA